MWFSATVDGAPFANRWCSGNLGQEGALSWEQTGDTTWKCQIPNEKAQLFLNLKLCISYPDDRSCSNPEVSYGTEAAEIYIAANLYD
jgi:hypothetical protein